MQTSPKPFSNPKDRQAKRISETLLDAHYTVRKLHVNDWRERMIPYEDRINTAAAERNVPALKAAVEMADAILKIATTTEQRVDAMWIAATGCQIAMEETTREN